MRCQKRCHFRYIATVHGVVFDILYRAVARAPHLRTIDPVRPTSRASCLKRLPTRSATRSTRPCSNTSIDLRPWMRKCVPGSAPLAPITARVRPESQRSVHALRGMLAGLDYQETIAHSVGEERWERELAGNAKPIKLLYRIAS